MPLYVFKCESCSREFEELCKAIEGSEAKVCPDCGHQAHRKVAAPFGISTRLDARRDTIYSSKEIDKVVGEASTRQWEGYDKRWQDHYKKRRDARRAGKDIREVVVQPGSDGKVVPFENLGTKNEQAFRKEYTKEYRKQVTEKGKSGDTTDVVVRKTL